MTATVEALLAELQERGIELRVAGSKLRVAPRDRVDDELLERLRQAKPLLLAALNEPRSPAVGCYPCECCGRFAFRERTTCYWCRTPPVMPA